ncbi:MAG: hypothetical protein ACRYHQ_41475 [Janthinobacterium lividum]
MLTEHGPLGLVVFCEGFADAHAGERIVGDIARVALGGWPSAA